MNTARHHPSAAARQRGISLIIILILMLAAGLLGGSAAVITLQAEKSARADNDRQLAFQAAEAALVDAQLDIDASPTAGGTHARDYAFSKQAALMFPTQKCSAATGTGGSLGLCANEPAGVTASWLAVDFDDRSAAAATVPFGYFTGKQFPSAGGALPSQLPRYVIELMPLAQAGAGATDNAHSFRITAIGYGAARGTQVILQAFYLKQD